MMKPRNNRHLLLATVAMTLFTGQAGAQLLSETLLNPNPGVQIPGTNDISDTGRVIQSRTVTSSVDPTLENPGAAVPSDFSTVGDNLGNHIAIKDMQMSGNTLNMQGGDILSGGGRVLGIQEVPVETDEASSKFYVDSLNSQLSDAITVIEGDVQTLFNRRINTPANQGLAGGGPLTSDLTLTVDGTVVRTGGDQVIAGAKTFIGSVDLRDNRLLGVGTPTAQTDGVNKAYVDTATNALGSQIDTLDETFRSRRIDTGTGLLGGGDLSQNRTLTFDTAWGDLRYALRSRTLNAGDGLVGGGDLSANRTFALDGTVVRTSGNQTIGGNKAFTGLLSFANNRLTSVGTPTVASDAATKGYVDGVRIDLESSLTTLTGRRIDTGAGLLGGGDLSQDRTLIFDTAWGDMRYALRARRMIAGDGISGGGDFSADRTLSVDATVVRTNGAQTVTGEKIFRQGTGTRFERGSVLDGITLRGGSVGTSGYSVTITPAPLSGNRVLTLADGATTLVAGTMVPTSRLIDTGDGLTGGGNLSLNRTLSVDGTVVRTSGNQTIAGNKSFTGLLAFSNNRLTSVGTPTVASDAATKGYVDGISAGLQADLSTLFARRIDAGTGLTGGGDLSADRVIGFDTTWGDARYALLTRSIAGGTGLVGGGDLSANRTLSFDTAWGDTRYAHHVSSGFANTLTYDEILGGAGNGASTFGHSAGARPSDAPLNAQMSGLHIGNTWGRAQLVFPNGSNRIFFRNGTQTTWSEVWHSGNLSVTDLTPITRAINTGTGLIGGGTLSVDRTLSFDTAWGDGRYALSARNLTAGDGLTGGGTLTADRAFAVDATVVRTSGAQAIGGAKTFTASPNFSNLRLLGVATPTQGTDAANKAYVDSTVSAAAYTAGTGLTLSGSAFSISDIAAGSTVVGTVRYNGITAAAGRFYGGATAPTNTTRLNYDGAFYATQIFDGGVRVVNQNRNLIAGDGISGGGDLSANRTFAVDNTVVRTTRSLSAGDGLAGGGTLAGDRSFSVDATVVRTSGAQTIGGVKTFTASPNFSNLRVLGVATPTQGTDAANKSYVDAAVGAAVGTTYAAGTGLTLSGTTFSITDLAAGSSEIGTVRYNGTSRAAGRFYGGATAPTSTTRLNYDGALYATQLFDGGVRVVSQARTLTAGDGLAGGGTLAGDRSFSVDATVVRTSGAQTIGGVKTFTASPNFSNLRVLGVATPTQGTDAANKAYVDAAVGAAVGTTYTAGTGLTLSGTTFSITDLAAGSTEIGTVRYNGTSRAAGRFYGGATAPTSTTRLNYDGALYATQLFDGGVRVVSQARTLTAGTGLTGGGTLAADRSFAFDAAWGDARYATLSTAQTISGAKTFTASPNFSNLRVLGVATPTQGTDAANKAYVDAAVSASAGTTYTAGTGLTLSGNTFALAANQIRRDATSNLAGVVAYNGHTPANAQFYGGTTNPTSTNAAHRVNFQGSVYATRFYATQYFYFSDETLKENVNRIEGAEGMALLREIRPVRYEWTETGREALGVIAQETARVLPNLVDTDPNGIMSVDYIQLIAPLIAAAQELDARVSSLEAAKDERPLP